MRKARSYRGENHEPGKDVTESLTHARNLTTAKTPRRRGPLDMLFGKQLGGLPGAKSISQEAID
jgi:hypothetical protein